MATRAAMATGAARTVRSTIFGDKLMSRLLQSQSKHSASETFISVEEHNKAMQDLTVSYEKAMSDLSLKMDEALLEHKMRMDEEMTRFRYDLKKESDEKSLKYCIDQAKVDNEIKSLDEQFKTHKSATECALTEGQFKKLRGISWGFFAAVALSVLSLYKWLVISV